VTLDCPVCRKGVQVSEEGDGYPFGAEVDCDCGAQLRVEYDYVGEDYDLSFWLEKR